MIRLAAAALLIAAVPAAAEPLTIRTGETWLFDLRNGEPANARKVAPSAVPRPGEIKASVNPMMGTTMVLTNATRRGYAFRAELIGAARAQQARTCILPAGSAATLENWPVKSSGVRLSNFRRSTATNC